MHCCLASALDSTFFALEVPIPHSNLSSKPLSRRRNERPNGTSALLGLRAHSDECLDVLTQKCLGAGHSGARDEGLSSRGQGRDEVGEDAGDQGSCQCDEAERFMATNIQARVDRG